MYNISKHVQTMTFQEKILSRTDFSELQSYMDGLSPTQQREEVAALSRAALAELYELTRDRLPLTIDDLVPPSKAPLEEAIWYGKNSLPTYSHFVKAFCRPDESSKEIWGYNRCSWVVRTFVGPGYFVAYPESLEIRIDYLRLPDHKPSHWPAIIPNETRLSRFVYNKTQDLLRRVSSNVCIGRVMKEGRYLDTWFALCRG